MKKSIYVVIIISFILLGMLFAWFVYEKNRVSEIEEQGKNVLAQTKNETINQQEESKNMIATNQKKVTISPNASIIFLKSYQECGHVIREKSEVPQTMVNLQEEDLKKQYSDWEIEAFSSKEIILSKEMEGSCGQHYKIQEKDGYVTVYVIQLDGTLQIKEMTDIATKYLGQADQEKLKEGISAIGQEQLNSILEDYE